jgi:PAS domain S-box-containing protein
MNIGGENFSLQNPDQTLSHALEVGQIAWYDWDYESGNVIYSPAKANMLGYSVDEFPNQVYEITEFIHPDDYEATMQKMRDHLQGKTPAFEITYRIRHKAGNYIYFYDCGKIIERTTKGKPLRLFGIVMNVTEQKEHEILLKKALNEAGLIENKLNNVIEQSIDGIRLIDSEGKIVIWNQSMERITGYMQEFVIGKNTWDITYLLTPDYKKSQELYEKLKLDIQKSLDNHVINFLRSPAEYELQKRDGKIRIVQLSIFQIETHDGLLMGSFLRDITEQKMAETSLKMSEEKYRSITTNIPGMVYRARTDGSVEFVSGCYPLLGYADEDLVNHKVSWIDIIHPDDKQLMMENGSTISKNPVSTFQEYRIITKDKNIKWVSDRKTSFFDKGNFAGIDGIVFDITEQKKNEAELARKDKLMQASAMVSQLLLANKPLENVVMEALGIIGRTTNHDRVYVFEFHNHPVTNDILMSQRFEWAKSGISAQIDNPDLQNIDVMTVTPRWYDLLIRGISVKGNVKDFPESERGPLQEQDIVSVLVMPVTIEGNCWGFVGIDNCHSEENWSDADSSILTATSSAIGMAIIKDRQKSELIKAKENAEESDRLKTAFLQNISHEIRTPMSGILGFISLLEDPSITEKEQHTYFNVIKHSSNRMLNTINNIIDISKIETGLIKIDLCRINLNELLHSLIATFQEEAAAKGLQLIGNITLPDQEVTIISDFEKLEAILKHLIKNAIKYTRVGSVEIGYEKSDMEFSFYVKDTGIGIPENRLSAVFERFIQADISDTRPYDGTGLGLTIVKSYVEMLGGTIKVSSVVGVGSSFSFTLPFNHTIPKISVIKKTSAIQKILNPKNISILVVEDDAINLLYFKALLRKHAENIIIAHNGQEAIDQLKNNPQIDMILMDMKMPILNGYETTLQIRQFNSDVKIIAQSAFTFDGDREKALHAGCDDYISKPIRKEDLIIMIEKHLKKINH